MITLRGGTVVTAAGLLVADVGIEGDRIAFVGSGESGGEIVDCSGAYVGPGFVDIHVHFREPGQTWKEDVETGSRAAAAGGFTAVVPMANTDPATDRAALVRAMVERGRAIGLVELAPAAALTAGRAGAEVSPVEELWEAGVRIFSDDGDSVARPDVLEEAMHRIALLGGVVAQHAEDATLTVDGHMHEGEISAHLGIGGLPAEAEERIIARDLNLAAQSGVHYHLQHVSTAGSVDLLRGARAAGINVTAEAAPHHFSLDHRLLLDRNTMMKMYPPLRTPADVRAVGGAVQDGTIVAVATDHAPHTDAEKSVAFEQAPRGIIGLETAASLAWELLADDPQRFFDRMSRGPARIAGLASQGGDIRVGEAANLVVFDPELEWVAGRFESRSQNSPWLGRSLRGRVVATVYGGRVTHRIAT